MDLVTAIKAGKDGFQFVRDLRGAIQREEVKPTEVADRLLQIQEILLELQSTLSDSLDENRRLRREVEERDRRKELEADLTMELDGHFLVKRSEQKQKLLIPYCPVCWGESGKAIAMAPGAEGTFHCVIHKQNYVTKLYHQKQQEYEQRNRQRARPTSWTG